MDKTLEVLVYKVVHSLMLSGIFKDKLNSMGKFINTRKKYHQL